MARRNTSLSLTPQGCRDRQDRLRRQLQARRLDAALLLHPHHVFYFANVWAGPWGAPALLIPAEGDVMIAAPDSLQADGETPAVDDWLAVRADDLATLRDRQPDLTQRALAGPIRRHRRLGVDRAPQPWIIDARVVDLTSTLLALRRVKDADELAVLRAPFTQGHHLQPTV